MDRVDRVGTDRGPNTTRLSIGAAVPPPVPGACSAGRSALPQSGPDTVSLHVGHCLAVEITYSASNSRSAAAPCRHPRSSRARQGNRDLMALADVAHKATRVSVSRAAGARRLDDRFGLGLHLGQQRR